jgi:hypothetical protein
MEGTMTKKIKVTMEKRFRDSEVSVEVSSIGP